MPQTPLNSPEATQPSLYYTGQQSLIRPVEPTDPSDMVRLQAMDTDPERIEWFESKPDSYVPLTSEELSNFARNNERSLLFGVAGSDQHPALNKSEVGEIQGWVKVNFDDKNRVNQLREQSIIEPSQPDDNVWEISYTKLPLAASRQLASGLRQACLRISEIDAATSQTGSVKPEVTVMAYVIPSNQQSIQALLAAGFEDSGQVVYDDDSSEPDHAFRLNWEKLNAIVHQSADLQIGRQ